MTRRDDLSRRVGWFRLNSGRELDRLAKVTRGEPLRAALYAMWNRRGWLVAATDRGLYLSRRPRVFGRNRDAAFQWSDLRSVRADATGVDLDFGDVVALRFAGPRSEFRALLETARGPDAMAVDELRELAKRWVEQ